jgi:hypothetical protein
VRTNAQQGGVCVLGCLSLTKKHPALLQTLCYEPVLRPELLDVVTGTQAVECWTQSAVLKQVQY